jgi:predicted Zn-dependent protease
MSKKGGGTRIGEQLFSENVNIYSDPLNPELPSATWDRDGLPIKRTQWVQNGVVKNLSYSRYWAAQKGVQPLPFSRSIVIEGGDQSLEDLIKGTEKGILVTSDLSIHKPYCLRALPVMVLSTLRTGRSNSH